jgi:hypothetical protein
MDCGAVMEASHGFTPQEQTLVDTAKRAAAPRITEHDVEAAIVAEHYFTAADAVKGRTGAQFDRGHPLHLLTLCVLVLRNGFTVTGENACASPENFDEAIGRKLARQKAVDKVWPLLGYQLRSMLAKRDEADAVRGWGPEELAKVAGQPPDEWRDAVEIPAKLGGSPVVGRARKPGCLPQLLTEDGKVWEWDHSIAAHVIVDGA